MPRLLDAPLRRALAGVPAVELRGPRGVGKTTTAMRYARTVFNLQDPGVAEMMRDDPSAALDGALSPVLIDEWQEVPEVLWAVKSQLDRTPEAPGQFILTGSVRSDQRQQMPTTGRTLAMDMFPFTVAERERRVVRPLIDRLMSPEALAASEGGVSPLNVNDYIDLALQSGYPHTMWHVAPELRAMMLRSRVDSTINADSLAGRHDRAKLADFMVCYANHSSGVVPLQSLCEDVGISVNTGRAYLALLSRTYLIRDVPAFHHNRIKRLRRAPKRLVVDAGLLAAVWNADREEIRLNGDLRGRLLETFVAAQLRAEEYAAEIRYSLHHLRRDSREVDFALDAGRHGAVGVEVKAGVRGSRGEARHLVWLAEQMGDSFAAGIVLHTGPGPARLLDARHRIWSAPISVLWT